MIIDVPGLLDELCVKLGICLSPEARARLSISRFSDVDSFEVAILHAEGIDPLDADRQLRHSLREHILRYVTKS